MIRAGVSRVGGGGGRWRGGVGGGGVVAEVELVVVVRWGGAVGVVVVVPIIMRAMAADSQMPSHNAGADKSVNCPAFEIEFKSKSAWARGTRAGCTKNSPARVVPLHIPRRRARPYRLSAFGLAIQTTCATKI